MHGYFSVHRLQSNNRNLSHALHKHYSIGNPTAVPPDRAAHKQAVAFETLEEHHTSQPFIHSSKASSTNPKLRNLEESVALERPLKTVGNGRSGQATLHSAARATH